MSNKHGETLYPRARNRTGSLPPGPAAGKSTNGKIGVPVASREQRMITSDMLPLHILERLPEALKAEGIRNGAISKAEEDWNHHRLPTSATFILKPILHQDEHKAVVLGDGRSESSMDRFMRDLVKIMAPYLIAMEHDIREGDKALLPIAHEPLLKRFHHLARHFNTMCDRCTAGPTGLGGDKKGAARGTLASLLRDGCKGWDEMTNVGKEIYLIAYPHTIFPLLDVYIKPAAMVTCTGDQATLSPTITGNSTSFIKEVKKFNVLVSRGVNAPVSVEPISDKYALGVHSRRCVQQMMFGDLFVAPPDDLQSERFLLITEILDAKLSISIWIREDLEQCAMADAPGIRTARTTYLHLRKYITQHCSAALALIFPSNFIPGTLPEGMAGLHDVRMAAYLLGRKYEDGPTE